MDAFYFFCTGNNSKRWSWSRELLYTSIVYGLVRLQERTRVGFVVSFSEAFRGAATAGQSRGARQWLAGKHTMETTDRLHSAEGCWTQITPAIGKYQDTQRMAYWHHVLLLFTWLFWCSAFFIKGRSMFRWKWSCVNISSAGRHTQQPDSKPCRHQWVNRAVSHWNSLLYIQYLLQVWAL